MRSVTVAITAAVVSESVDQINVAVQRKLPPEGTASSNGIAGWVWLYRDAPIELVGRSRAAYRAPR